MLTIITQANLINQLLGIQKVDYNKKYRLLTFCYETISGNDHLLYNNLTKELLYITKDEQELIKNKNFNTNNKFIIDLIEKWFLVPYDFDDIKLNDQILKFAKLTCVRPGINACNIFTTTACNARCFYCFEAGTRVTTMTPKTADAVANYIINNCIDKRITLQWFGGEPLCNARVIDIICKKLCENSIEYKSVIITNGYLFNENLIKDAKELWKTQIVQITLDGTTDTYNRVKNYINPVNNPFEKVINNISALLANGIRTTVRLNMDLYNEKELYTLTDYLAERFGKYDNFKIYTALIYEGVGFIPTNHEDDTRIALHEKYFALIKYQDNLNLVRAQPVKNTIRIGRCSADSLNAVQISPEGKLGNCEHFPDSDFYGSVFTNEPRSLWTDYADRLEICKDCAYYPTCFVLKRCNTPQCSKFRKRRLLEELGRNISYTYEMIIKSKNKSNMNHSQ